ncbi:DUF992 domain-containing protein [Reyranella sp.]|uniref:DUF992 domain-containing protein n=1 Tax=Reyranella sp. TaxID=1929291 RepID=UPI002F93B1AB
MRRTIFAMGGAVALVAGAAFYAQTHAESESSVNIGSLTCNVTGGAGFVFGTTRDLDCLFARSDGKAEAYRAAIKRFGAEASFDGRTHHIVWLVYAPEPLDAGGLAGDFGAGTPPLVEGKRPERAMLVDHANKQIALAPVQVPGEARINAAAGVAEVALQHGT